MTEKIKEKNVSIYTAIALNDLEIGDVFNGMFESFVHNRAAITEDIGFGDEITFIPAEQQMQSAMVNDALRYAPESTQQDFLDWMRQRDMPMPDSVEAIFSKYKTMLEKGNPDLNLSEDSVHVALSNTLSRYVRDLNNRYIKCAQMCELPDGRNIYDVNPSDLDEKQTHALMNDVIETAGSLSRGYLQTIVGASLIVNEYGVLAAHRYALSNMGGVGKDSEDVKVYQDKVSEKSDAISAMIDSVSAIYQKEQRRTFLKAAIPLAAAATTAAGYSILGGKDDEPSTTIDAEGCENISAAEVASSKQCHDR